MKHNLSVLKFVLEQIKVVRPRHLSFTLLITYKSVKCALGLFYKVLVSCLLVF